MAWVVNSLEEAVPRFGRIYDAGPFIVSRHIKVDGPKHRGCDIVLDFSTAIAQAGPVQIELVEQHNEGPSPYRDLVPKGQVRAPQGPRYTSKARLDQAKNLDDVF